MTVRAGDIAEVREGSLPCNGGLRRMARPRRSGPRYWDCSAPTPRLSSAASRNDWRKLKDTAEGDQIAIFYDRNDLVEKAVWTVQEVLIEATLLVVILLLLFLGNLRAAIVVATSLPLAVLASLSLCGCSAGPPTSCRLGDLRSRSACWSIAPSDRRKRRAPAGGAPQGGFPDPAPDHPGGNRRGCPATGIGRDHHHHRVHAAVVVAGTGRTFVQPGGPDDQLRAGLGAAAFDTVVPLLSAFLLKSASHHEPWGAQALHRLRPALGFAMRRPRVIAALLLVGVALAGYAFTGIGSTFLPVMDEGTPIVSIRKYPTMSVEEK